MTDFDTSEIVSPASASRPALRDSGSHEKLREPYPPVVRARFLAFFPELVAELGGDLTQILMEADLTADCLDEASSDYRRVARLLEVAAATLGRSDFAMRLASRQGAAAVFGLLGSGMRHSRSLGDALTFAAAHSYVHSPVTGIWLQGSQHRATVTVGHEILLDALPNRQQIMEQILLLGHLCTLRLTDGQARPLRVMFRHRRLSTVAKYRRYFGCEVRFSQRADALVFPEHALTTRLTTPNEMICRDVIAAIQKRFAGQEIPVAAKARGIVTHFLGSPLCTRAGVAAELKLHPRTMDRRLAAEGTSFLEIKDQVRRDLLLRYLPDFDLNLAQISEKLGFSEQSVLTRSSQRWFGTSPLRLRAQFAPGQDR